MFVAFEEVVIDLGSDFQWKPEKGALMTAMMVSTISPLQRLVRPSRE